MSEAQNKTIAERFNDDVWGTGDEAALEELFAPDFVDHGALPGQTPDREGHKQTLAEFRSAFPNLSVTTDDIIAEGEKVVSRWTARGTHQGELMGIAPTGKEMTFTGIEVLRIAESKVVERWAEGNDLEVMQQIGAIPPPGHSEEASPT
jgi:predicted ester cyclase